MPGKPVGLKVNAGAVLKTDSLITSPITYMPFSVVRTSVINISIRRLDRHTWNIKNQASIPFQIEPNYVFIAKLDYLRFIFHNFNQMPTFSEACISDS